MYAEVAGEPKVRRAASRPHERAIAARTSRLAERAQSPSRRVEGRDCEVSYPALEQGLGQGPESLRVQGEQVQPRRVRVRRRAPGSAAGLHRDDADEPVIAASG